MTRLNASASQSKRIALFLNCIEPRIKDVIETYELVLKDDEELTEAHIKNFLDNARTNHLNDMKPDVVYELQRAGVTMNTTRKCEATSFGTFLRTIVYKPFG